MAARKTTRMSRNARRRSGSPARKRASRAKPRSRFTTTKQQRTAYKESAQKTNYLPLLGLAGLLGLGGYLLIKNAQAGETPPGVNPVPGGGGVNPVPGGGGGPSPGGFVHPPAGTQATVNATVGIPAGATPGLNLRASPSPTGALVGGSAAAAGLPNNTPITVVRSNVVEDGRTAANKERWWQVTTGGRTGFIRAVGPGARPTDPYVWNVTFAGQQTATGRMLQANYTQVIRGYDAYNRPVDQFGRLIAMAPAVDPYQALVMRRMAWGR